MQNSNAIVKKSFRFWDILLSSCMVAGTTIGAGMLGIPMVTSLSGFFIACLCTTAVCCVLYISGLYYAEATLLTPTHSNLISISEKFLGKFGKWSAGAMFFFLYYALLLAYASGIGGITTQFSWMSEDPNINTFMILSVIGGILFAGVTAVDRLNFIMSIGLILSFILLVQIQVSEVSIEKLSFSNPGYFFYSIPVLFSAFGFHNIVPTICDHLNRDRRSIKIVLLLGSALPLIIYVLWQLVILGSTSRLELIEAQKNGVPVSSLIKGAGTSVVLFINMFSIFAILTSVLGVGLSMIDFISDGWEIPKVGKGRILLTIATLLPPFLLSVSYPHIFETALGYAGGFGEAFLNCLLPAACVYAARYRMNMNSQTMLPGGKALIFMTILIGLGVMLLEGYIAFIE